MPSPRPQPPDARPGATAARSAEAPRPRSRPLLRRLGRRAFVRVWPHLAGACSRPWAQARLEEALYVVLAAMNYTVARSGHLDASGERWWLSELLPRLPRRGGPRAPLYVVDAGAHVGDFCAALLAALPAGQLQVAALEPQPALLARLRARLADAPGIDIRRVALGATSGALPLWTHAADPALASLVPRRLPYQGIEFAAGATVAVTTLDALRASLDWDHVGLLKLDVEGHELAALDGARQTIAAGRLDVIQFEYGAGNIDARTYFRDFWERLAPHFHIYRLLQRGLCYLPAYRETYEQMLLANYVAVGRHLGPPMRA